MKHTHWMTATAAVFALAAPAPAAPIPAAGDKSPLSWVPATAPVVIHLNGPQTLRNNVVAFLRMAVPDQAETVEKQADEFLKNGVEGRKLRGVSKDGPIFVVFTELPKPMAKGNPTPPEMALIFALTDYAEFRDNALTETEKKTLKQGDGYESATTDKTNQDAFFVDKKDYVIVTPSKDVAAAFAKGGAPGLDGKMDKAEAAKFLASDLGVYVDMESINKEYGDQIKDAHKQIDKQFQDLADKAPPGQKGQVEMVRKMLEPIFQAIEDCKSAVAVVNVGAGGVALHKQNEFRSGTPTADLLKGSKTSAFEELGKLPAGDVFYAGMEIDPAFLKFSEWILTAMSNNPDAKGAKELAETFEEYIKAGPTEAISAVRYPVAGLSVTKCADPEKAVAAATKMLQVMGAGGFGNVSFKEKPEVKKDAEKYRDVSFTSVHMVWDLDKMMSPAGGRELPPAVKKQMIEGMKKLMGEETNAWIGVDGKAVVQVTAKDWESAQKILEGYYKGEGAAADDKAFAAARKGLPDKASVVVLIDAVQAIGDFLDFLKPIVESTGTKAPAKFPKPVTGKPGFLGLAVTLEPERISSDLVVPSDTVKQVYESYVKPLLPPPGGKPGESIKPGE